MKNKLQQIREKNKMTRKELAEKLNMSEPNLFKIENNTRELNKKYFDKITQLFSCSISQLFGEEIVVSQETVLIKIKYYNGSLKMFADLSNENNYKYEFIPERLCKILKISNYSDLIILNAWEKNMEPLISLDDFIIVDLTKKKPENNGIYLMREEEKLKIKKILRKSPKDLNVSILSETQFNDDFDPYELTMEESERDYNIGKVVFYGRSIL